MTITLNHPGTDRIEKSGRDAYALVGILRQALDAVSQVDPDLLHSDTYAGQAAICLADEIRAAGAALGLQPGGSLRTAPGVVVVRDLAVAASRLEHAVMRCDEASDPLALQRLARRLTLASRRLVSLLPAPA